MGLPDNMKLAKIICRSYMYLKCYCYLSRDRDSIGSFTIMHVNYLIMVFFVV